MTFRHILSTATLLLPLIAAPLTVSAASNAERKSIHTVDLRTLAAVPSNYEGLRVQFRALFVERSDLFDTFHTPFADANDLNLVLWDDQANLWVPEVRGNAVTSIFFNKLRARTSGITDLKKYQPIDVVGYVVSSHGQEPWIDVHSVTPVKGMGTYSDASVFLLQQGVELADNDSYILADQNFVAALKTSLADDARISALDLRARNLINWGHYSEAVTVVDEALALHQRWEGDTLPVELSQLHYLAAKAYSELASQRRGTESEDAKRTTAEHFLKSIEHAELAVELDPDDGDAFAILGIGLSGLEKYDEARVHCQRAILMRPNNATIRWYLGRILDRQGDYAEAITVLNRAIDLSPKDYRIHKTIAMVHLHRSENEARHSVQDRVTALREFDIAIRLNNKDPDLFYYSGVNIDNAVAVSQKIRIGKKYVVAVPKLAADRYHTCIETDDSYLPAFLKLGNYYRTLEKHDKAISFFQRALELDPADAALYVDLGTYFIDLGRLPEAYSVYAAYQLREPQHLETLYVLGKLSLDIAIAEKNAEHKTALYTRGIEWHEALVALENKYTAAHADLAEMYVEVEAWTDVVKHADMALAALTDDAQILRVSRKKGIAHWGLDEGTKAIIALTGRTAGCTDLRVVSALGWALSTQADAASETLRIAQQALALNVEDVATQELLAWAHYLNADFAQAETMLNALPDGLLSAELKGYRLGMTLYGQGAGRYTEAKRLLTLARSLRSRRSTLRGAAKEASVALRAISDYDKGVQRQQAAADKKAAANKRAADKKAAANKRAADKKAKAEAAKQARADAVLKRAAIKKAKADAAKQRAMEKAAAAAAAKNKK